MDEKQNEQVQQRERYEPPAIVYEGVITTRAGSRPNPKDADPSQLFGNVD